MGRGNGDLALTCGRDQLAQTAHDVFFLERVDDLPLEFLRHEVSAVRVHALGQHVVNGTLAAEKVAEVLLVRVRRATELGVCLVSLRLSGQRIRHRLGKLRGKRITPLHAVDLVCQVGEILLHAGISRVILGGKHPLVGAVRVEKAFHGVPEFRALFAQFGDGHSHFPSFIKYSF